MSSVHIPRVLTQRGKSSLEIERENFEKTQARKSEDEVSSHSRESRTRSCRSRLASGVFRHIRQGAGAQFTKHLNFDLILTFCSFH